MTIAFHLLYSMDEPAIRENTVVPWRNATKLFWLTLQKYKSLKFGLSEETKVTWYNSLKKYRMVILFAKNSNRKS